MRLPFTSSASIARHLTHLRLAERATRAMAITDRYTKKA